MRRHYDVMKSSYYHLLLTLICIGRTRTSIADRDIDNLDSLYIQRRPIIVNKLPILTSRAGGGQIDCFLCNFTN